MMRFIMFKNFLKVLIFYFDKNDEDFVIFQENLKWELAVVGHHCANHEIQDVAFTAFKNANGEVLFDLSIMGDYQNLKQIATRTKKYVKAEQIFGCQCCLC